VVRRVIPFLLVGIAAAAMAWALRSTWNESQDVSLVPSLAGTLAACALSAAGVVVVAFGWRALFPPSVDGRILTEGFYLSQLGKYVPGGIWQPTSQVVLARKAGASGSNAAIALPVYLVTAAIAYGLVGSLAGFAGAEVRGGRLLMLLPLLAVGLDRRWMARALALVRRFTTRLSTDAELPDQRSILVCGGWQLAGALLQASAFTALYASIAPSTDVLLTIGAFGVAWLVGFLAVPLPAGFGVREAVLVALLGGSEVVGPVVAAAVYHRLINIGLEFAAIVATRAFRSRSVSVVGSSEVH
jgi:glycosyltransferase 2 family protein